MRNFGWKVGIDYSPHLSDEETACFACVLGMPWVDDSSGATPRLDQATCEHGFGDWLAPWYNAPIEWVLLARDNSDADAQWITVGTPVAATEGLALSSADRANLVNQCCARLHAYVREHPDALGLEPLGDESPVFTYPLVSPGIALLPAYLSDSVLGTSAILKVDRRDLPANPMVMAVPKFVLSDGNASPLMDFLPHDLIRYQGPTRTVNDQNYQFNRVHGNSLKIDEFRYNSEWPVAKHRFLSVRNRTPDRQLYAMLSRKFSPLRMWLSAVKDTQEPGYTNKEFCSLVVRLLGAGEDELDSSGLVVGSIYEMVLSRDSYNAIFKVAHALRQETADKIYNKFKELIDGDADGQLTKKLLKSLADNLAKVGLEEDSKRIDALSSAATDSQALTADTISKAFDFYALLEQQHAAARAGWAAWLATVLQFVISAMASPPPKSHVDSAIEFILEGAKAGMRDATGQAGSVLEDDVLRLLNGQIDHAPKFWTWVHNNADSIADSLTDPDAKNDFLISIVERVAKNQPNVARKLDEEYEDARDAVKQAAHEGTPQADDLPLQLGFRPAQNTKERSVRGCLLALRIGVPRSDISTDWRTHGWITNAWAQPSLGDGTYGPEMIMVTNNAKAVFCDTQGSTQSDGLDEQVAVYDGTPLLAADEQTSPNRSMPEVFRYLPTDQPVPELAYGACYSGFSVTVDNAGAIIERALRGAKPGMPLEPIPEALFNSNGDANDPSICQYLSRRPPGAPIFIGYKDWDVKQDTLTLSAAGVEPGSHHVSVLYSGPGYRSPERDETPNFQEVQVRAPSVGPAFVKRWLAADALVDQNDQFRWLPVRNMTSQQLRELQEDVNSGKKLVFTHPAVFAVEIRATWFTGNPNSPAHGPDKLEWKLEHFRDSEWLQAETLILRLEQAEGSDPSLRNFELKLIDNSTFVDIVVPKGMQVRLEARSLIQHDLLDGVNARLNKDALVMSNPTADEPNPPERPYVPQPGLRTYESREPQVMWIESLPEIPTDENLFNFNAADFRLVMPSSTTKSQEIALEFNPTLQRSAHWIARVELEHKRWQWSGYPVQFPTSGALDQWLPLYAGTKDYMPKLPSAGFKTKWVQGDWFLDALVMKPLPLPEVRPANHMGFVVKAVPRFAKLLADSTLRHIKLTYVFDRVRGVARPRSDRLTAPVWNEAIPMTQTVNTDSENLPQASRGNLIVLADPLYDTSDTGAFGGIAERVEFDVVATPSDRILEAGPNPIFHKAPLPGVPQPSFKVDSIFGLLYDQALGGRPAQTGIVLRPKDTNGQWTLAKCRLRRFILPDLMLDTELTKAYNRDENVWEVDLGLRQVEQGWVPQDFVLYSDQQISGANLPISGANPPKYTIKFPETTRIFARAYLVTWHRDRWGEAEPKWRPLVRLYERHTSVAEWTLEKQTSPFQFANFEPLGKGEGKVKLTYQEGNAIAYRIDVSEFTESRWLTFIGSFGQEVPLGPEQIEVARVGNGYKIRAKIGVTMPVLSTKNDVCPSLLLIFAPQLDLMRGRIESEGGELVGVYAANRGEDGTVNFDEAILPCTRNISLCQALLIQIQRHNVESPDHIIEKGKWTDLVNGLFPQETDKKEATMRFLPEYIGPMKILPE